MMERILNLTSQVLGELSEAIYQLAELAIESDSREVARKALEIIKIINKREIEIEGLLKEDGDAGKISGEN